MSLCVSDLESRHGIDLRVVESDGLEGPIVTVLNYSHPRSCGHR